MEVEDWLADVAAIRFAIYVDNEPPVVAAMEGAIEALRCSLGKKSHLVLDTSDGPVVFTNPTDVHVAIHNESLPSSIDALTGQLRILDILLSAARLFVKDLREKS